MILDVIGFGALNFDRLYQVDHLAFADEESHIINIHESCGGSAANTIIGLSRLGISTGFIGQVAQDREGKLLLNHLKQENVDENQVLIAENGHSGMVHGFVDPNGERALYVDSGVNSHINPSNLNIKYINQCRVLHLTSFLDEGKIVQEEVINKISKQLKVSLDPGTIYARLGLDEMDILLNRTNFLLLNEQELDLFMGKGKTKLKAHELMESYQLDLVVVKMGDEGSYITNKDESHHIKAFPVQCQDSTGAGDAYNAGLLFAWLNNKTLKESAEIGNYVASCSVQTYGACNGLPDLKEINKAGLL